MTPAPRRTLIAILAAQFLLSACSTAAHGAMPHETWPAPQPEGPAQDQRTVGTMPNFKAPSATHCMRPVVANETPGGAGPMQARRDAALHRERLSSADSASPASPTVASESRAKAAAAPSFAPPRSEHSPQPQQQPHPSQVVTAGVVDDNADFSAYMAFRDRTRVQHRERDVRERYLLKVKDAAGRGVADAEVAINAPNGSAMWARTDTAGRVWLHPDAFDPGRARHYDIAVRKDGRIARAQLARGQNSAVEVRLDARPALSQARLDLVFLIDATGSMADEIQKLKTTLRTIVGDLAQLPSRPDLCLGLVAYRDRGDAFLVRSHDFTNDVSAFLGSALMPLHADGGGDYPEAMNEALHETVHRMSWRGDGATRMVILLADAPPHLDYGVPHYDDDMLAALGKGIKVFGVGASGLDKQGEFIQRQIAQYTGGKFVFLTYANRHNPSSGPGRETVHDVKNYSVDTLDRLIVRLVTEELAKLGARS